MRLICALVAAALVLVLYEAYRTTVWVDALRQARGELPLDRASVWIVGGIVGLILLMEVSIVGYAVHAVCAVRNLVKYGTVDPPPDSPIGAIALMIPPTSGHWSRRIAEEEQARRRAKLWTPPPSEFEEDGGDGWKKGVQT